MKTIGQNSGFREKFLSTINHYTLERVKFNWEKESNLKKSRAHASFGRAILVCHASFDRAILVATGNKNDIKRT